MPDLVEPKQPLLEVKGLGIALPTDGGRREVVKDLSLAVGAGEAVAVVGESGAGKSLTAKAIARLLPPGTEVSGEILFEGKSVGALEGDSLRAYRTNGVGLISQDPRAAINPVRRIGDFLTEALIANHGVEPREARERVIALLEEAGVTDPRDRLSQYPHELSGGILQRVMIASVIAVKPKLILADEPTTALDVTTQSEVMAILNEMRDHYGMALILITHDLDLAAAVCGQTAVMYAGRVCERQPSRSLHDDPLHPYTAALVTSRPQLDAPPYRLPVVAGRPLAAFEVAEGCAFAPRCSYAQERCYNELPALTVLGAGESACFRSAELRETRLSAQHRMAADERSDRLPATPQRPDALLDVRDLRKVYATRRGGGSLVAVDGVSLKVGPGEAVGLVGESGSGKTTTAKIIVGREQATSGSATVCGEDWAAKGRIKLSDRRQRARQVQMVFQDPYLSLDRRQTIGDGLREVLKLHFALEGSDLEARVESLLDQVGLSSRNAHSRPHALSGGERQRAAIARALAPDPQLVVLDEAVAALDVSIQAQILNLLDEIRNESGVAYLLITHDLAVVNQVTDRVLVMREGRVVEEGETSRILEDPQDSYTRRLLASVPRPGWRPTRGVPQATADQV